MSPATALVYEVANDTILIVVDLGAFSYNMHVTENEDGTVNIIDKVVGKYLKEKTHIHLEKSLYWLKGYVGPERLATAQFTRAC